MSAAPALSSTRFITSPGPGLILSDPADPAPGPSRPTRRRIQLQLSPPDLTEAERAVVLRARVELDRWDTLDVGQRSKLVRNLGLALASGSAAGISGRRLGAAVDLGEAAVRKAVRPYQVPAGHAPTEEDEDADAN